MQKRIPVVFIHEGNQKYLKNTVGFAEKNNVEVYLLGNDKNSDYCKKWFDISLFKTEVIQEFRKYYKHMSCNPRCFEMLCFERYFILFEFVRQMKFECVCMVDSDNILYTDVRRIFKESDKVYFSYKITDGNRIESGSSSGHCAYWPIAKLKSFCEFIINTYKNDDGQLKRLYNKKRKTVNASISDMDFLDMWGSLNIKNIKSTDLEKGGYILDHNVNVGQSFEEWPLIRIKKTVFIGEKVFFIKNRKKIRVHAIHAQGNAKKYIPIFCKMKNGRLKYYLIYLKEYLLN